mmetsp:Transcript_46022/g.109357  ORF Transcript_46022/g.109357 Transcript_46022/m.109357 type:complete len:226 (-) Transcript_46022:1042-1719(-)
MAHVWPSRAQSYRVSRPGPGSVVVIKVSSHHRRHRTGIGGASLLSLRLLSPEITIEVVIDGRLLRRRRRCHWRLDRKGCQRGGQPWICFISRLWQLDLREVLVDDWRWRFGNVGRETGTLQAWVRKDRSRRSRRSRGSRRRLWLWRLRCLVLLRWSLCRLRLLIQLDPDAVSRRSWLVRPLQLDWRSVGLGSLLGRFKHMAWGRRSARDLHVLPCRLLLFLRFLA